MCKELGQLIFAKAPQEHAFASLVGIDMRAVGQGVVLARAAADLVKATDKYTIRCEHVVHLAGHGLGLTEGKVLKYAVGHDAVKASIGIGETGDVRDIKSNLEVFL